MKKSEMNYCKRWRQRILETRRKYFFERFWGPKQDDERSFLPLLSWLKDDVVYSTRWIVNILLQIRRYGFNIKKIYKVSYTRQFARMMYLTFIIRVRPSNFRKYRLFKQKNWEMVNGFIFAHADVQREFSNNLFPEETDLFLNKFLFNEFCKRYGFPSPNILAAYENGQCRFLKNPDRQFPEEDLFIKKTNGMMGHGAKKLVYNSGAYFDKEGNKYDKQGLFTFLEECSSKKYPLLLQNVIKNHSCWMGFTSGALATCRIVTYRLPDNSKIEPLFAAFRMPVGAMDVDNFSAGGIAAPIQLKNGILGKGVCSKPINNHYEFTRHPDTN